jgi:L-lysine exporter family protein LysE/ArgO
MRPRVNWGDQMDGDAIPTFAVGLAFGAGSLVSIGPNNILLLREGLGGRRPALVAWVMWLSYAGLLGLAVFAGHVLHPLLEGAALALAWAGAVVLAAMGVAALRASGQPPADHPGAGAKELWSAATGRVLRVVWLNPLTYLELVAVPAALALPLPDLGQRFALYVGLLLAFALNCFGFSCGAALLSPVFRSPSRLRLLNGLSGALMIGLAIVAATHASQIAKPDAQPTTLVPSAGVGSFAAPA